MRDLAQGLLAAVAEDRLGFAIPERHPTLSRLTHDYRVVREIQQLRAQEQFSLIVLAVLPGRVAIPGALTPVTGRSLAVTRGQLGLAVQQIVGAFAVASRCLAGRLGDAALACVAVPPSSGDVSLLGRVITAAGDGRPVALVSQSVTLTGRGVASVGDDVTPPGNTVALIGREVTILSRDRALLSITVPLLGCAVTLLGSAVTISGRPMSTISHDRIPPETRMDKQTHAQDHVGSRRE